MMPFHSYLALALLLPSLTSLLKPESSNIMGARTKVVNGMIHFGSTIRRTLPVSSAPLPAPLHYAAGNNCTFELVWSRPGASELNGPMTINTAPVRDRVAISIKAIDAQTSLLITPSGKVTNFNSVDPFTRERITSSNLSALAERTRERLRQMDPEAKNPDVLIGLPMLPRLVDNDGHVGSKVAVVDSASGEWATYYYQGMIQYKSWNGAVLDLIRVMDVKGKPTSVRLGFLVAEYRTMMPLFFVFENVDQMRVRVTQCDH
ncbi:MAG: hypothetical protein JWO81_3458 [Alphaproteobacteria bacterium]|nr:hypothetical protein [Alphaproteobacteria bacterium]